MAGREFPDLVLLFQPIACKYGYQVYGLGFDGDCIIFKKLLSFDSKSQSGIGFAVSGTKLYAVGSHWNQSPKDVKIWDLSDWRNKNDFPLESGQTLGEKPCPVVFEANDRIYALGGMEFPVDHKPDPAFEVFDPNGVDGWARLSDPPFIEEYTKPFCPFIKRHTIIGNTFFLALAYTDEPLGRYCWDYYSYCILTDKWDTITQVIDDVLVQGIGYNVDPRVKNFIEQCRSIEINHVNENNLVFRCRRNMEVYVCDLDSDMDERAALLPSLKRPKISDDDHTDASGEIIKSMDSASASDKYFQFPPRYFVDAPPPEAVLPDTFFRVYGFENLAKEFVDCVPNTRQVLHLTGDVYCLMYCHVPYKTYTQKICFAVFEARKLSKEEQFIEAKVLFKSHIKADLIMHLQSWCKLKFSV